MSDPFSVYHLDVFPISWNFIVRVSFLFFFFWRKKNKYRFVESKRSKIRRVPLLFFHANASTFAFPTGGVFRGEKKNSSRAYCVGRGRPSRGKTTRRRCPYSTYARYRIPFVSARLLSFSLQYPAVTSPSLERVHAQTSSRCRFRSVYSDSNRTVVVSSRNPRTRLR